MEKTHLILLSFFFLQSHTYYFLIFATLWANSADNKPVIVFLFFLEQVWHFMQIVSIGDTICMKCQILFSGKIRKKKNISKCCLQKNLSRVLSIKESHSLSEKDDFAFHSDIPYVLGKKNYNHFLILQFFFLFFFILPITVTVFDDMSFTPEDLSITWRPVNHLIIPVIKPQVRIP